MASLQDLESFEPLNHSPPIQILAIYFVFSGKLLVNSYLQFLVFEKLLGNSAQGGSPDLFIAGKL